MGVGACSPRTSRTINREGGSVKKRGRKELEAVEKSLRSCISERLRSWRTEADAAMRRLLASPERKAGTCHAQRM